MKAAAFERTGIWNRSHYLDKMSFKELVVAYFQHAAIIAYLALAVLCVGIYAYNPAPVLPTAISLVVSLMFYPVAWYGLHRWVLHGRWMFKIKPLAPVWKRIHFDHHQDPNHLEVLFGALSTTLPAIILILGPVGYLIGGIGGGAVAVAGGLLATCFYEFVHCVQHLKYKPRNKWLATLKARHMAHHFHDESGNFGITNFLWDRVFGTYYDRQDRRQKSETVFNLGYTPEEAKAYPWVSDLSGGIAVRPPSHRDHD